MKQQTISFVFCKSDMLGLNGERLTVQAVVDLYNQFPDIGQHGIPLTVKEKVIGKVMYMGLIKMDTYAAIECKAVITDPLFLNQPWLSLENIARASLYAGGFSVATA